MNRFYNLAFEDDSFIFTTDNFMFYDKYTRLLNDNKNVRLYFDQRKQKPYSEDEVKELLEKAEHTGVQVITICIRENDTVRFIGSIKIKRRANDAVQLSIALISEYQNKGYGRKIINKVCKYINLTDSRIFVRCKSIDTRSLEMFKSCGFDYHSLEVENIWLLKK